MTRPTSQPIAPAARATGADRPLRAVPPPASTDWRMRPATRKIWLIAHVASAGGWIGIDVILATLIFTALFTDRTSLAALSYQALPLVWWPMLITALVCLVTGVVLGLGTKWGLVRHWWVVTKLALNVVLVTLIMFSLRSGLDDAAAYGRQLADGLGGSPSSDLLFPPIVSPTALLFAMFLSVFKPWGRIRRRVEARRR
jgi:hypothetical protein